MPTPSPSNSEGQQHRRPSRTKKTLAVHQSAEDSQGANTTETELAAEGRQDVRKATGKQDDDGSGRISDHAGQNLAEELDSGPAATAASAAADDRDDENGLTGGTPPKDHLAAEERGNKASGHARVHLPSAAELAELTRPPLKRKTPSDQLHAIDAGHVVKRSEGDRGSQLFAIATTLAAVASLVVFMVGLHNFLPQGDIDALDKADHTSGKIVLQFLGVPRGFQVVTSVSIYDTTYTTDSNGNPIHDGFSAKAPPDGSSDLGEISIRAELVAPKPSAKADPGPVTWVINSSDSGQLADLAWVHDNGKVPPGLCPTATMTDRIPDNATRISASGPDPKKLSYGYLRKHPPTGKVGPHGTFTFPNFAATPDRSDVANEQVVGPATVYAGVVCPSPTSTTPEPHVPECKDSEVIPAVTVGPDAAEKAQAHALGTPPPVTQVGFCPPVITKIEVGDTGSLMFATQLNKPLMINSSSGDFATHLPQIRTVAVDDAGHQTVFPVEVSVYSRTLLGDAGLLREMAPQYPIVDPERYRWVSNVKPEPVVWCAANSQCPHGRALIWAQQATPLDIEVSGTDPEKAHAFQRGKDAGVVEWTVGLTVLVPLLGVLIGLRVHRKRKRHRVGITLS